MVESAASGAIIGPVVAGNLMGLHWSNQNLFLTAAAIAMISAIAMIAIHWILNPHVQRATPDPAPESAICVAGDVTGLHWSNQNLFLAAAASALIPAIAMIAIHWILNPHMQRAAPDPVPESAI